MRRITSVVIHHTAVANSVQQSLQKQVISMNNNHKERIGNPDMYGQYVQYHYVVGQDGTHMTTRPHSDIGRHASNYEINANSIGICMTGNFDVEKPIQIQIDEVNELIEYLQKKYGPLKIYFHNEFAKKTCPGKNMKKEFFTLNKQMTQEQLKMLVLSLMNLNSSLYSEVENIKGIDLAKTRDLQESLNKINKLFRSLGIDNK